MRKSSVLSLFFLFTALVPDCMAQSGRPSFSDVLIAEKPIIIRSDEMPKAWAEHPYYFVFVQQWRFWQTRSWSEAADLLTPASRTAPDAGDAKRAYEEARKKNARGPWAEVYWSFVTFTDAQGSAVAAQSIPVDPTKVDVADPSTAAQLDPDKVGSLTAPDDRAAVTIRYGVTFYRKQDDGKWLEDQQLGDSPLSGILAQTPRSRLRMVLKDLEKSK